MSTTPAAGAPVDEPTGLRGQATAVVRQAIAGGDVGVALQFLEIDGRHRLARRRMWLASLVALVLLGVVGAVVVVQTIEGGNSGAAAPAPLGFSDTASAVARPTTTEPTTDPVPTEVAGVTETVPVDPAPSPLPPASGAAPIAASAAPRSTPAPRGAVTQPGPADTGSAPSGPSPTTPNPTAPGPTVGALDGAWAAGGGSQAGYRVTKTWITGAAEEVVGRTTRVSAALTISQDKVTAAAVVVDMASVDSANAIRDAAFRQDILNTTAYPTARFDLTGPIDIAGRPAPGTVFTAQATGRLTIRGVTRDATVAIQARQSGGGIQVVGSIPVAFADFGVPTPDIGLATVANAGTVEFQVNLAR